MGQGRFMNQKLAKKTGYAERQAGKRLRGRIPKRIPGKAAEKASPSRMGRRGIITMSTSPLQK